jgi:chromosome segregation ATPase
MTNTKRNAQLKRLQEAQKQTTDAKLASAPDCENVPAVSSLPSPEPPQIRLEQSIASLKRQQNAKNGEIRRKKAKIERLADDLESSQSSSASLHNHHKTVIILYQQLTERHNAAIASIEGLTSTISSLSAQLSAAQAELSAQHQSLQASENALQKSHMERQKLHDCKERLQREVKKLHARNFRTSQRKKTALVEKHVFCIKAHGRVRDVVRDGILELVRLDIASSCMYRVFVAMAGVFGVELSGKFSTGTVLNTIEEGRIAGLVQLGHVMSTADSECLM